MSVVAMNSDKQSPLRSPGRAQALTQEQERRKCGQKAYSEMTAEELAVAKVKRGMELMNDTHEYNKYLVF